MKSICSIVLAVAFIGASCVLAGAAAKGPGNCPDKILRADSITGTYQGWQEVDIDFYAVLIHVSDDMEDYQIEATEAQAKKYFGNNLNKKYVVNYKVHQYWNPDANYCAEVPVLIDARPLGK